MSSLVTTSNTAAVQVRKIDSRRRLRELLQSNLEFHEERSNHSTHDFHAFPAKFPPQLPRAFINNLTLREECVLDPMMGSGTTLVEALAAGRRAVGFDIDPLAVLISSVKTRPIDAVRAVEKGEEIATKAKELLVGDPAVLRVELDGAFDTETREFLNYWFSDETQLELIALKSGIQKVEDSQLRDFLQLCFSAIIITKSGGVSLAWDLAHTRPHKFRQGEPKSYRHALPEFIKRLSKNASSIKALPDLVRRPEVQLGNAEKIDLPDESVDLLFTSPPYASNAIDYMRASKFSLVWLGYDIAQLTRLRSKYIGGENVRDFDMEELPSHTSELVEKISAVNKKRGSALRRYYSEMTRVLKEAKRVLKPDRTAAFVAGSAVMAGIDSEAQRCLGEIGAKVGLDLVEIGVRRLDRNRRMLPVTLKKQTESQIENRMHQEYVIGFYKPALNEF
jgi:DNA modification methylase